MSSSLSDILPLADTEKFLLETGNSCTSKLCHNACVWLAVQIKKAGLPDYNIHICTGTYSGFDHSWVVVENMDSGSHQIIDMTLDQFEDCEVPYSGPMHAVYNIHDSISLCESDRMQDFIEAMGY